MPAMSLSAAEQRAFLRWYDANRRDLPWRHTRDPYRIWISEIMLQQTRVAVVIDRYERFLRRFPSVRALARAQENEVLAEWSGLGYYRRARNLHAAAKRLMQEHAGEFPSSSDALRKLPGIGRYTAAAIASIAFGEPVAVVDGNVERVLRRMLGNQLSGERIWFTAQELLDVRRPGDFNQSMMELGATVCLPTQPVCGDCPVRKFCRTQGHEEKREPNARQQKREVAYLLKQRRDSVLLVRRAVSHKLMPGMWELPEISSPQKGRILFSLTHSITVTNYKVHVVGASEAGTPEFFRPARARWVKVAGISDIPLTGLARKILRRSGIMRIQ